MALELTVDFPHYEKGLELDLSGILVVNGQTTKVDEDAESRFVAREGKSVREALKDNEFIKVAGSAALTPSKIDAAKDGEEN